MDAASAHNSDQMPEPNLTGLLSDLSGNWKTQVVLAAVELRIFEYVGEEGASAEELAQAASCASDAMRRLCRALASIGLFIEKPEGQFAATEAGRALRGDHPYSIRNWALWWAKYNGPVWAELTYSVQTGKSARELIEGRKGFGLLEQDAEAAQVFHAAMKELTRLQTGGILRSYDFAPFTTLVDIGGGHGELLNAVLEAHPRSRGLLFDLPHSLDAAAVHERCEKVTGDFFLSVPPGGDLYILKSVLHDWNDEDALRILQNCHRAMSPQAKLLVIGRLVPPVMTTSAEDQEAARFDLHMLLAHASKERSRQETESLLRAGGFEVTDFRPGELGLSLIEAAPKP